MLRSGWRLRRLRFALRALAVGSSAVESHELLEMSDEPKQVLAGWTVPSLLCALVSTTFFRPKLVDLTTGVTLCLLGAVIVAAAALPLFGLLRAAFSQALELAPPDKMRRRRGGRREARPDRRARVAAHDRGRDDAGRLLVAGRGADRGRALAPRRRAQPRRDGAGAGTRGARGAPGSGRGRRPSKRRSSKAASSGFDARVHDYSQGYAVTRGEDGIVTVVTPLDDGSAEVRFLGTTEGVLGLSFVGLALMVTALAGWLGTMLGTALGRDLRAATRDVRDLGTEAVLSGGTRVVRAARFRMVARLGQRHRATCRAFSHFCQGAGAFDRRAASGGAHARLVLRQREPRPEEPAQRRLGLHGAGATHRAVAGSAREPRPDRSARARAAGVDRDHLGRRARRSRTAQPAAGRRGGAGACSKKPASRAKIWRASPKPIVVPSWDPNLPLVRVDPVRIPRALATFVAHSLRSTTGGELHVHGSAVPGGVRIDIELPRPDPDLETLLKPNPRRAETQHRGLALGLRLARSVVELHGGTRGDRRARRRPRRLRFAAGNAGT